MCGGGGGGGGEGAYEQGEEVMLFENLLISKAL